MFITKEFTFDASHFLPKYHGKCENLHGHTYRLAVTLEGEQSEDGLIIDFVILKEVVKTSVIDILDHHHLNDIVSNPSAENMAVWIWEKIVAAFEKRDDLRGKARLFEVRLWETVDSSVSFRGA